jgi:activating signal cointegrator 1
VKAISLWQPWASAIAAGLKTIETRHWATNYRGRLAIHAARRWTDDQLYFWSRHVSLSAAGAAKNIAAFEAIGVSSSKELPLGAIVATCTLFDCRFTKDLLRAGVVSEQEQEWGDFSGGRVGWLLQDVVPLPQPVPFKGRQGFFEWKEVA